MNHSSASASVLEAGLQHCSKMVCVRYSRLEKWKGTYRRQKEEAEEFESLKTKKRISRIIG